MPHLREGHQSVKYTNTGEENQEMSGDYQPVADLLSERSGRGREGSQPGEDLLIDSQRVFGGEAEFSS